MIPKEQDPGIRKPIQPLGLGPPHGGHVVQVHEGLDDVERRLRGREPAVAIPRRPAVDIVDAAVQRVRLPQWRVVLAARHRVRPQEDVARVPHHQRQRDGQPDDEHRRDRVPEVRTRAPMSRSDRLRRSLRRAGGGAVSCRSCRDHLVVQRLSGV